MSTYQRVTYRPEGAGRSVTVYLENPSVTTVGIKGIPKPVVLLTGKGVDKEGNQTDKSYVIEASLLRKQTWMTYNIFYGELEEAGS